MADDNGLSASVQSGQTVLGGGPEGEAPVQESTGSEQSQAEGSVAPKWTEQLPREYRDKFAGYESYKDFVAAAAEAIPLKDKAIVRPADDAPSEDWDRFYAAVGRPDGPDGYEIEGDGLDEFKATAHKLGLTSRQAKEMFDWYSGQNAKAADAMKQEAAESVEKVVETLRSDWGESYDANMKAIERFKKRYGSEELAQELQNPMIGNNINLIKALAKAGKDLAPETLVEGRTADRGNAVPHFTYATTADLYPKKEIRLGR